MSRKVLNCDFCYRRCAIPEGKRGFCGIRENVDGELKTIGYGRVLSAAVDPIEKKPLYHVYPGGETLSIALFGCNFRCEFCQNFELSQPDGLYAPNQEKFSSAAAVPYMSPEMVVELMFNKGLKIMTYTYSEPIVWQDYMLDTAKIVHEAGGINCMVTNGSFSSDSLERVLPLIDAFNIDVKGDESFYKTYCAGSLAPVLQGVERIAGDASSVLEVTTLVIEGIHTEEHIRMMGKMLADAGVQVWHLSRFFPYYHMNHRAATTEIFLDRMLEVAAESGIPYLYAGNSGNLKHDSTSCPSCGTCLIRSHNYRGDAGLAAEKAIHNNKCAVCGEPIYGLF